jgi:hypothetical protein
MAMWFEANSVEYSSLKWIKPLESGSVVPLCRIIPNKTTSKDRRLDDGLREETVLDLL